MLPAARIKLLSPDQVHLAFDGRHPIGACHHQKIAVIDDSLAFCGGIDMTGDRWDTRDHRDGDPHRVQPSGKPYKPWHDAISAVQGPVAHALGELFRRRWHLAGGMKMATKPSERQHSRMAKVCASWLRWRPSATVMLIAARP